MSKEEKKEKEVAGVTQEKQEKQEKQGGKKCRCRKVWKIVGIVAAVLAVLLVVAILLRDIIIASAISGVGSMLTGTKVTVEKFSSSLSGKVEIVGLRVGNPEGFRNPQALEFERIAYDMSLSSLFADCIEINLVAVEGMHVNYEPQITKMTSNLGVILENLERFSATDKSAEKPAEKPAEEKKGEGKPVLIHRIEITGNRVSLSNGAVGTVKMPLPGLVLNEVGGKSGNLADALSEILTDIAEATAKATGVSAGAAIDSLNSKLSEAGKGMVDSVKDAGSGLLDKVLK